MLAAIQQLLDGVDAASAFMTHLNPSAVKRLFATLAAAAWPWTLQPDEIRSLFALQDASGSLVLLNPEGMASEIAPAGGSALCGSDFTWEQAEANQQDVRWE